MQIEGTRPYRVKEVAEHFDVSVSTIYRAIEAGQLDALKLGTGRGTLRVPGSAVLAYAEACTQAAYEAFVTGDASAADVGGLSAAQADGLTCVVCNADFLTVKVAHRPVGRSHTGSQVFACSEHADQPVAAGVELAAAGATAGVELAQEVAR